MGTYYIICIPNPTASFWFSHYCLTIYARTYILYIYAYQIGRYCSCIIITFPRYIIRRPPYRDLRNFRLMSDSKENCASVSSGISGSLKTKQNKKPKQKKENNKIAYTRKTPWFHGQRSSRGSKHTYICIYY